MRIFHILADKTSTQVEDNFISLIEAFSELGFAQHAVIRPDEKLERFLQGQNVHTVTQKFGGMFDLRTKKVVRETIKKFTPHIVHGHGTTSLDFHTEVPASTPFVPLLVKKESLIQDNDKLLSAYPHALLVGYHDKKEGHDGFKVLPPLIRPLSNTELPPPISRSDFGTPDTAPLIGTIGTLTDDINLDIVFQAIREIPSTHLWISGDGPKKQQLKDLAAKRGIHDRVHFPEAGENHASFLSTLELCIIPSQTNDASRLIMEAWSLAVPVLSCLPLKSSPLEHEHTGWIENTDDILKLRAAIDKLISDEALRKKLGENGQNKFLKEYDYRKVLGQYLNAYKDILAVV